MTVILDSEHDAKRVLEALDAAGYSIVPRKPTPKMLEAGWAEAHAENAEGVWREMIEAAIAAKPSLDI